MYIDKIEEGQQYKADTTAVAKTRYAQKMLNQKLKVC